MRAEGDGDPARRDRPADGAGRAWPGHAGGRDAAAGVPVGAVIFANPEVADALADGAVAGRVVPDPGIAPGTALMDVGVAQRLLGGRAS